MPHQLLRAHEVAEYVFNVADVEYPVSIRDQMNRVCWIVQQAYDLGFFGPRRERKYCRLLICGAGAAGVSAALHALALGVETVLVEKSSAPFLRQRMCTSRWIDPSQYDWTAAWSTVDWTFGSFPYPPSPPMPLPWQGNRSHRIALGWWPFWTVAAHNPLLTFRAHEWVITPPRPATLGGATVGVEVTFRSGATEQFGMMLWCVGFGDERRYAPPNYAGFGFWETDPFEWPDWGITGPADNLCAVVSGGGDGALQDVIRLSTGQKSAKDVLKAIEAGGWTLPMETRASLFAEEDQAQRALLWCDRRSIDEHLVLKRLHDAYLNEVDHLLTVHEGRHKLIAEVRRLLAGNMHPVLFVHPCCHFARCYGLNHFLVLILAKVAAREKVKAGPEIRQGVGVSRVSGASGGPHTCGSGPWACHGAEHEIELQHRPLCHAPAGGLAGKETAHVVVLRHGVAQLHGFANAQMAFARQTMPYWLPGP